MSHPPPAPSPAPPAAAQLFPDRDRGLGPWARLSGSSGYRSARPFVLIPVALLSVAVVGVAAAWLAADLPADWRGPVAVGAVLAACAVGIGAPALTRARRELDAAQQLLESAAGELARVNEDLRQTADARDRALANLRASVEEREMFLNSVAHDLNTPLTVIKGHTELMAALLRKDELSERGDLVRRLTRISASVQQLTDLVDELLWLGRLGIEEPVALDRRPTDLIALAGRIVDEQSSTTARHRIRFEPACDRLVGRWDPRRLGRAIGNLIANAIKYSPEGGDIRVTVATDPGDSLAVVTVQDQGVGIAPAEMPRVFERFYRGEGVKLHVAGTGVGLAAVKHAVEAHGGTVAVDSREGSGTTFTVRLPLDAPGEAGAELVAAPPLDRGAAGPPAAR